MPPHLRNDEASFGYNAYSILITGRDEYGEFLPILFKSFGDWKPGLYIYITSLFVAVLGLNEWTIRLPAAISGILSIYLLYILVLDLFKNQKIALAAAFSLAISPWHVAFSRGAWEAQVTITLMLAGSIFAKKALDQACSKYLILATLFFGLSFLMYHGAKPAIPLLLLSFLVSYWKKLLKIPIKLIFLSGMLFVLFSLPIIFSFFNGKSTRISSLLFTSKYQNMTIEAITSGFFKNWANHYSLPILFVKGDGNPQHTAPLTGAFISLDIVFLLLGLKTLAKLKNVENESKIFIYALIILTPLSSALTSEGVNFVRYLMFFIVLNIIIGLGISNIKKNLFWRVFLILYFFSFLFFLDAYFIHSPAKNGAWQYGYKQMVQFITPIQSRYQTIYIPQGDDQPYIFFLLYQKYSPEKFQAASSLVNIPNGSNKGMDYISKLDNIEFVDFNKFNPDTNRPFLAILPANNTYNLKVSLKTIHEVKDPIGFTIYKIEEFVPNKQ